MDIGLSENFPQRLNLNLAKVYGGHKYKFTTENELKNKISWA